MRIFITGTAGFIGFHVANRLLAMGCEVTGYDGMTPYYDVRLKQARHAVLVRSNGFRAVEGLLEDAELLARAVEDQKPDVIIHLAAQAGVRYSLENPKAYVDSNLVGTFNVLEMARRFPVRHLLLASSSSVYGANEKIPFEESDHTDEPLTLYAASKKAAEVMAHSYAHLWKIPTTAFRFFTVYGPYGRPDMALFKFIDAIKHGRKIDIYGEGKMRRDFTYIDDLVEAVIRLIDIAPSEDNRVLDPEIPETLSRQAPFRVVNIGGGQAVDLLDFIDTVERALGIRAERNMLPMQKGDVPQTFASPALLKALTGYVPQTTVNEGVPHFVRWYEEFYGQQDA